MEKSAVHLAVPIQQEPESIPALARVSSKKDIAMYEFN